MKMTELKQLEREELMGRAVELTEQYRKLRLDVLSGREKNTAKLKQLRRDMARVKTLL